MENIKAQHDAFYTMDESLGVRFIAHSYDQAQPLAGPWTLRRYPQNPTHEEIEKVLTGEPPKGQGYRSAVYLEPDEFASAVLKEHKRVWLAVYRLYRDEMEKAKARKSERRIQATRPDLEEALEKLRLYHNITREQADQLLAEKADEAPSF